MNEKVRIEVDEQTAEVLEARAAARGMTVSALIAELIDAEETLPPDLQGMRAAGEGPWAPEALAEDARRLAEFRRTREALPWDDVKAWMQTWGTPHELPTPKPRKL
jgi:hypothetical protein